jgi:hypothetical protein
MTAPEYRFVTDWRVPGTPEEVSAILEDARGLSRWWPSVYLDVDELESGDELGVGKRVRLHTKGWLPYTLRWQFRVTESRHPHGFSLEAVGDLAGSGAWTLEPWGIWTNVRYDWRVRAEKPLLRILSPLARPLLEANHRWAMRRGEESLRLELARRRASTDEERARVPAPPPPTSSSPLPLLVASVGIGAVALVAARLLRSRRRRR